VKQMPSAPNEARQTSEQHVPMTAEYRFSV
jgi:hypothetical protein